MEIIQINYDNTYVARDKCVACIGFFDGIHKGHLTLVKEVLKLSKDNNRKSAVICFDEDPWVVMGKIPFASHITPHHKQMQIFEKHGIDICYLLHFTKEMMQMSKEEFIEVILNKLNIETLICGTDFTFAIKGEGNVQTLKDAAFNVKAMNLLQYGDEKVSSSIIEKVIEEGNIVVANDMLGYPYAIEGIVVHGANKGNKDLGFPTANMKLTENYIIPKQGVYVGKAIVKNETYKVMINIGHNPTMNYQENISIEGHILDFDEDIYGETITYIFENKIRDEKKFDSIEALIKQLKQDVEFTRNYRGM